MTSKKSGKISSETKTEIFKASVFDVSAYKTERTCVAKIAEWMNRMAEEKALDIGPAEVETRSADDKYPDIVIYENPRSQTILCVVEFKPPLCDPFDAKELKEPARLKATHRRAKYFATSNFKSLIWFNTEKANALKPEEEQIVDKYHLSELENLDEIEQTRYSEPIKRGLENFLTKLYSVHSGQEPEPKQAIDEFLVFRLQEKIRLLSTYYRRIIDDQCHKEASFANRLKNWFVEQRWTFAWQPQDFDRAARQTAYLLVNKIVFYNLLQAKRARELAPLEIPKGLLKGSQLHKILQSFFDEVLKIDYETLYTTNFIDTMAFPEAKEVVKEIEELVEILRRYDFSKLGYDVIGRIFERLIPPAERHHLGQYFTSPDVVDLILRFCLHHEDDKILDPACGAGTFLVRAYQHKKLMNQYKQHQDLLNTLWGNDIAKFPAHLATINLAINDLGVDKNYPNILQEDFFALLVGDQGFDPENWRKARAKTLGLAEREVIYPRWFDAVVGNPPYTRQEEIGEISPEDAEYKAKLIQNALYFHNKKMAEIGKRAGIHAYFFVHGTKFLKDGGYFGFIVSNSWLDVEYGKGLQEFFLNNYQIIAIIESKVERWFEEADINTCIVILQKCQDKKEREKNLLRFVYLKKPLRHFIPPAQDIWEKQVERLDAIDKLKKTILAHSDFYENEDLRIFPKSQKELWDEGFDTEEQKYVGAKWGKYLRAPEIFFKILDKGKGKLVPLKELAEVRFGIKTGANEFFYLTEDEIKRRGIEREFWMYPNEEGNWVPNYVLRSFKETSSISVERTNLVWRILLIHKDKEDLEETKVLEYIQQGENREFGGKIPAKTVTCYSRGERWYDLSENTPTHIFYPRRIGDRFLIPYSPEPIYSSDNLFPLYVRRKKFIKPLAAFLNSIIAALFNELSGRRLTGAINVVDMDVWMAEKILIPNFKTVPQRTLSRLTRKFSELSKRPIENTLKELGASLPQEVSLDKIKPDRRELDKIIMGEILGLTEEEQLEVYRAVVDLVKSRIEKAKSFEKKKKLYGGGDVENLKNAIISRVREGRSDEDAWRILPGKNLVAERPDREDATEEF
ncbi:MAG: N-6 DNA methylase [candidate division KSB1 bacterium]|nr:N-6 DNA methylase [candidate division KSB1 bacterium]